MGRFNSHTSNKVQWVQNSTDTSLPDSYYDALSGWSSDTQKVTSTFGAALDSVGKYKGTYAITSTNAKYLPNQIEKVKNVMRVGTLEDARGVIKSSTAKGAVAMAEYAAKFEGVANKLPYLGRALTVAEESKRIAIASNAEETARVVAVGSFNYFGDNMATSAGVWIGAQGGALTGAFVGSVVPIIGSAAGAVVGGIVGAVGGAFTGHAIYDSQAAPRLRATIAGEKFRD